MKPKISYLAIIISLIIVGCMTEPSTAPSDPFVRAYGSRPSWYSSQNLDAAVVILRNQSNSVTRYVTATMAFDEDGNPSQVQEAEVNGVSLAWQPIQLLVYPPLCYASNSDSTYGGLDSTTFSYAGFSNETWNQKIFIAPPFIPFNTPDTVSISQGLTIRYSNPVPNDSIEIQIIAQVDSPPKPPIDSIEFDTSLIDNGLLYIPSQRLPQPSGTNGYDVRLVRFQFASQVSPKGKVIGIYSEMDAAFGLYAKP